MEIGDAGTGFLVWEEAWSVEVSCPWRGACARKSGRGCYLCKAANKNCNANCQCRWHSCNEVTKRPTAGRGLKIIKRPTVRYFSIFLFEIQNIYTKMFYIYLQSSGASRQPKFSNLMFLASRKWKNSKVVRFADPEHRVRRDPSVSQKIFLGHYLTRSSNN